MYTKKQSLNPLKVDYGTEKCVISYSYVKLNLTAVFTNLFLKKKNSYTTQNVKAVLF